MRNAFMSVRQMQLMAEVLFSFVCCSQPQAVV